MNCIPKHLVNVLVEEFKSGKIKPEDLYAMGSKGRHEYFGRILGGINAGWVNAKFEQGMLRKVQQEGFKKWLDNTTGVTPEIRRDLEAKILRNENLLNGSREELFMKDLVEQKMGVALTPAEASAMLLMAKDVKKLRTAIPKDSPSGSKEKLAYSRAEFQLRKFMADLKREASKKDWREWTKIENFGEAFTNVAGFTKAMKATFDNSIIGRQGRKVMATNPEVWFKNSLQSFVDLAKTLGGNKNVLDEIMIEIGARDNALNGLYKKYKVDVGVTEENFPTELQEKIPLAGRAFRASRTAFSAWQYRTRADLFDLYYKEAEKLGADPEGAGLLVNALTGRGDISKYGLTGKASELVNNAFFSPRFMESNINALTAHIGDYKSLGKIPMKRSLTNPLKLTYAKNKALSNTLKIIGSMALVMVTANAIRKGSVEEDQTSSDAGKLKIGNTRFDISGGMGSLLTLAARIATGKVHNSDKGYTTDLYSKKFGARDKMDVINDFIEGKTSPAIRTLIDLMRGRDFSGREPNVATVAEGLLSPITITTQIERFKDPKSADWVTTLLADFAGFGANTYGPGKDWSSSTSKEMIQFRERVGEKDFLQYNKEAKEEFVDWLSRIKDDERYKELTEDQKAEMVSKKQTDIKKMIMKRAGFYYRPDKNNKIPVIE